MNSPKLKTQERLGAWPKLGLSLGLVASLWPAYALPAKAAEPSPTGSSYSAAAVPVSGTRAVTLTLQGSNINEYLVAETPNFLNTSWTLFSPNGSSFLAADGQMVEVMYLPYILSAGDGTKTIYVKYRNGALEQSAVMTVVITLQEGIACTLGPSEPLPLTGCEGLPLTPISEADKARYRLGVSPTRGEYVPESFIFSGDYIRSNSSTTVYCVTKDMTLRPFMDETSFFTQTLTFLPVKWVRDNTLSQFTQEAPMLLRQDVGLVKFETDPKVYYFVQDPFDPNHGILHWISTEELAEYIAGDTWANYVIDINPTLAESFDIGTPYLTVDDVNAANIDLSSFRSRQLLNERSATTVETGVVSNLWQQGGQALRSAASYILQSFQSIGDLFRKN